MEGQIKGVKKMLKEKEDCLEIITQIMALREAANMLGLEVLKQDLCHIRKGNKINEKYLNTLFKLK